MHTNGSINGHEFWITWGQRICAARQAADLSQSRLGALVGREIATVRRWESGANPPPDDVKLRLCFALNRSWGELFPAPILDLRAHETSTAA